MEPQRAAPEAAGPIPEEHRRTGADAAPPGPVVSQNASLELLETRSGELEEIISFVPNALIRWGIGAIAATLLVLLVISWLVHYPELVKGDVTIISPTPPVRIVAGEGGQLERLFVEDGQSVEQGAVLGVLRSSAVWSDVLTLAAELERFAEVLDGADAPLSDFDDYSLGDSQERFTRFLESLDDYRALTEDDYFDSKISTLEDQVRHQYEIQRRVEEQRTLLEQELSLAERQHRRDQHLASEGVVSKTTLERSEAEYLRRKHDYETGLHNLVNSEVRAAEYESALLDLRQSFKERERELRLSLRTALNELQSGLREWQSDYLLAAPVSGRVSFLGVREEGQYVAAGEALLAVVPDGAPATARMLLPQEGAGRVRVGQTAILRLHSHPAAEFGFVRGRVESISLLPARIDGAGAPVYQVVIDLPNGLLTSYDRKLQFRQEMAGTAEIVTEDLRLLERFFHHLRQLTTSRFQA